MITPQKVSEKTTIDLCAEIQQRPDSYIQIPFSLEGTAEELTKEVFAQECPPGTEYVANYHLSGRLAAKPNMPITALGVALIPREIYDKAAVKQWKSQ